MTWPTVAVNTTNCDSDTDNLVGGAGASAREDILDAIQKLNQAIAHVSAFIATVLDDADAAAVRATIGAQASDADLTALAALASTGIAVRSAADTWVQRSIAGTANQVTLTNGDGVSGNPTVSLPAAITLPGSLTMGGLLNLAATGQIQFPAAQNASANANCLDDYEEGTFTPSVGGTATYNVQLGNYVKIGKMVVATGFLAINSIGTGSQSIFSGLPFTVASNSKVPAPVIANSLALSVVSLSALAISGGATVQLWGKTAAAVSDSLLAALTSGSQIDFGCIYFV